MRKFFGSLVLFLPLLAHADIPSIGLSDFSGRPVPFAQVQREVTLVAFWIAACVPCIEEMPLLDALAKKLSGDKQTAILGVNLDDDSELAAAQKVLNASKVSYPMLRDPQRNLVGQWFPKDPQKLPLPTVVVFDRKFHALFSQGFKPGTSAAKFIDEWTPRLAEVRAGKLREHLQKAASSAGPTDVAQLAQLVEKIIRSHHPEMSDADVKLGVEAAIKEFQTKGTLSIK